MFILVEEHEGKSSYTLFGSKDRLQDSVIHNISLMLSDDPDRQDQLIRRIAPLVYQDDIEEVNDLLDESSEDACVAWGEVKHARGTVTHVLLRLGSDDFDIEPLSVGSGDELNKEALTHYRENWWINRSEMDGDLEPLRRALDSGDLATIFRMWSTDWDRWEVHPITRVVM